MRDMRNLRNIAIVMLLALGVAFLPGGDNAVETVFTALIMCFLAGISWMLYTMARENQLTLASLRDSRRAMLYGGLGMIALLIAGTDKLFSTGGGTLVWIVLLAASVAAIWRVWVEANTHTF